MSRINILKKTVGNIAAFLLLFLLSPFLKCANLRSQTLNGKPSGQEMCAQEEIADCSLYISFAFLKLKIYFSSSFFFPHSQGVPFGFCVRKTFITVTK
jgi:hypothetical protein